MLQKQNCWQGYLLYLLAAGNNKVREQAIHKFLTITYELRKHRCPMPAINSQDL